MTTTELIIVFVVAALVVVAFGVFMMWRQRRSEGLRSRFGPEYYQALKEKGDRAHAEADLEQRRKRVETLRIKPISPADSARFSQAWQKVQTRFVDDPEGAITDADQLLGEVMAARGYPVSDFEQRAADLSVDHPTVVKNYRAAHQIALRHQRGEASTEDLRQAMIHYRTLFMDLVGQPETPLSRAA